ncbi:MAG: cytochrome c oxidase subunit II [Bacteroidetes bacterium]|nr:cytochrome c oxidase subunit II [Bacteroidota bacterium]
MGKLGILLVIVLGAIAIAQLVRVYEYTLKLKKTGEHDINDRDNNLNAWLMLLFMIFQLGGFIYLMLAYGWTGRGPSASLEGDETDWLLNLNFVIIIVVFFLTNFLLFYFSFKYVRKPGVRATYYPHNNKLEMIWTVVPACVLAVIIILGLRSWNKLTSPAGDEAVVIELYSKQFDWTARYAGQDNVLGKYDYKLTTANNELGILTTKTIKDAIDEREKKIKAIDLELASDTVLADSVIEAREFTLSHNERILRSLYQLEQNHKSELDKNAEDDIIVKGTLVLCVGQEYEFNFRSMDVIHSAYFPHFRAQINTVPGMTTRTKFTPKTTTAEMQKIKNDPKFKYILMCNKICGKAHYKMKMDIEVLSKKDFEVWYTSKSKETFKLKYGATPAEESKDTAKEGGGTSGGDVPVNIPADAATLMKKEDEINNEVK